LVFKIAITFTDMYAPVRHDLQKFVASRNDCV